MFPMYLGAFPCNIYIIPEIRILRPPQIEILFFFIRETVCMITIFIEKSAEPMPASLVDHDLTEGFPAHRTHRNRTPGVFHHTCSCICIYIDKEENRSVLKGFLSHTRNRHCITEYLLIIAVHGRTVSSFQNRLESSIDILSVYGSHVILYCSTSFLRIYSDS